MERTGMAMRKMASALSDPGTALAMSDGQWLALAMELEVAERELTRSAGNGEDVYGHPALGRAVEKLLERIVAELPAQRQRIEALWAEARRERPNN